MNAAGKFAHNVNWIIYLSQTIENHARCNLSRDLDKINWPDVGDTGHVIELLEEITEFLNIDVTNVTLG